MGKEVKKRGLAVIYDPHNLYQFVWYYCNKGKGTEWDALCLPNAEKGEYMHSYCENSGIFRNVYRYDTDFGNLSLCKKITMFCKMMFFFVLGQRKRYCKKLLNQYIEYEKYDEFVVLADVGMISGAIIALGDEKDVIILEDGIKDYYERSAVIKKEQLYSFYSWQGWILSKMGYCSPGWFDFAPNKYCVKYASQPSKMQYKNYKEIRQLYDEDGTDKKEFSITIEKIYPGLKNIDFNKFDTIIFSHPINDYLSDDSKYKRMIENYIAERCKKVIIKKHPREEGNYFIPSVEIIEIDNSIPGEVLLPYLKGKNIIFGSITSLVLYLEAYGLKCTILDYEGLYEESILSGTAHQYYTEEKIRDYCENFASGCYELIKLRNEV